MNRKLLVFYLLITLICVPLLATAGGKVELPPEKKIKAVLNKTNDNSSYDIGFSSAPVNGWADTPTRLSTGSVVLSPVFEEVKNSDLFGNKDLTGTFEMMYATSDNGGQATLHIYWRILSFKNVKLSLKIDGPMTNAGGDQLNWCIKWDYKNPQGYYEAKQLNTKVSGDNVKQLPFASVAKAIYGPVVLAETKKNFVMQGIGGSTPIHILTEDIMGKSIDSEYSGTLTLIISVTE